MRLVQFVFQQGVNLAQAVERPFERAFHLDYTVADSDSLVADFPFTVIRIERMFCLIEISQGIAGSLVVLVGHLGVADSGHRGIHFTQGDTGEPHELFDQAIGQLFFLSRRRCRQSSGENRQSEA